MSSPYDWIPDHHLGVAATLAHADEVIAHVADILFKYQTQPSGIFRLEDVPTGRFSRTVVASLAPIPRKVPLLVADAMVALRNALEHTLFAEVEYRDGVLGDKVARFVEMPATKTYDDFQNWVRKQEKNGPASLRKGSELLRRIDALQPFHRTQDPQHHPMALLASHTNHSKHRAPAITAVRLAAMYREDQMPHLPRDLARRPEVPLQLGDVIAETPIDIQVPVTMFPTVGINRPGTLRWPVLMKELEELASWTRTQAVPRLITGTDPPIPSLPARYEISFGHGDDRRMLSKGSTKSAAQAHLQRLNAVSARVDMVETIGLMEGAPSPEQIAAWLRSLPDEVMLARMSEVQINFDYEPAKLQSNLAVLERMREDALRFAVQNCPDEDQAPPLP